MAHEAPQYEPGHVADAKPNRQPDELKEPNENRMIAVPVNPTEYVDDQGPPAPPPTTYATPTLPDVINQWPVD